MEPVVPLQATEGEAVQTSTGDTEDHATEILLDTSELPTDSIQQLAQAMDPRLSPTAEGDKKRKFTDSGCVAPHGLGYVKPYEVPTKAVFKRDPTPPPGRGVR